MKKVDLHIHTLPSNGDVEFDFDMDVLESYVIERDIDIIAITNHNIFDLEQYREISSRLSHIIVLPGIEVNIGINCGHMLVISSISNVEDFNVRCIEVSKKVTNPHESLSLDEFRNIFGDLRNYLIIPHYDKKPSVDKNILRDISEFIECGEVSSIKKFIYCQKNEDNLAPTYFSDFRPQTNNIEFPTRQTFLNIDEVSLNSIKLCLKDKRKVSLTEAEGNDMFYALPDLKLSTGLNVIIGGRSSGKTYTLNSINESNENVKYIKQFSLLEKDPNKAEKNFTDELDIQQNKISKDYFSEFSDVLEDIMDIHIKTDEKEIEDYISALLKYSSETERLDTFSKCSLYPESSFRIDDLDDIKGLIRSVEKLLDSIQYQSVIEKYVNRDNLIALHKGLIEEYIDESEIVLKKRWTNDVVSLIKNDLQSNTASTRIPNIDLYDIQMNKVKINKFTEIANNLRMPREIYTKELNGFRVVADTKLFVGAQELKNVSGKVVSFSNAFGYYNNPYNYLQELKEIEIDETTYYKYFVKVEYKILNRYGFSVSGGERAEFNLLKEIDDALQYDLLLIDEPESSFDNLFLRERVNSLIKSISQKIPVIITTHNNTIGASIQPDFLVFTKREIHESEVVYKRFYGMPSNRELVNNDGETISNIDITLNCLEAGEGAYKERGENYEMLRSE